MRIILLLSLLLFTSVFGQKRNLDLPEKVYKVTKVKKDYSKVKPVNVTVFMKRIRKSESQSNNKVISTTGCLGMYQFRKSTLLDLGYDTSIVFIQEFLVNEKLQHQAFSKLLKYNKRFLRKYIKKYAGTNINNIEITEAGILAGAHLGGPGSIIKWLKSNGTKDPSDAYGTKISDYVQKFSDIKNIKY